MQTLNRLPVLCFILVSIYSIVIVCVTSKLDLFYIIDDKK